MREETDRRAAEEELRLIEEDRSACKDLHEFIRRSWHVLEPSTPLVDNWHIGAIAMHLEAVTDGKITRLLINVPPGTLKSVVVSVQWPAWEWGPRGLPGNRFLTTSYHEDLTTRDSRRMRDLIASDWYQARWPTLLVRDQAASFENDHKGWRVGVPFSRLTGGRAHRVVIDDPHSTEQAESDAERKTSERIFRESIPSRMVEPSTSAIVIIMQRLHVNDIAGIALSLEGAPYVHLMLPMRFETARACETAIGFRDPRTKDGELLFPGRFPKAVVDRDEKVMGSFATAGQHQQRPVPREGGLFKRKWFKLVQSVGPNVRWVRYWDLAASKEQVGSTAAWTVGLKLGRYPDGRFIVGHVNRLRAEGHGVRRMIRNTAKDDGRSVEIGLPQDPGAAGKMVAQDMVLMLAGYVVTANLESGDKLSRAEPFASQAEAGNVDLLEGEWNETFLAEAEDFPGGRFKDQIDAASGAFGKLIGANVFNVPEDLFTIEGGNILALWGRVSAIHIGRSVVTTVHVAHNRQNDTLMVYHVTTRPRTDLAIHSNMVKRQGPWIPVLFDLEGDDRKKDEGRLLAQTMANNNVEIMDFTVEPEAAVDAIATRLNEQSLLVFRACEAFFETFRRLRRGPANELLGDEDGVIAALGLIVGGGSEVAITENRAISDAAGYDIAAQSRDPHTGY